MTNQNHKECPYTDCGSSDAFSWNPDGYGKCHSCDRGYPMKRMPPRFDWVVDKYPLPDLRNGKTREETLEVMDDPFETPDVVDSGDDFEIAETNVPKVSKTSSPKTQVKQYLPMRGINASTMEKYGVYGDMEKHFYPYPNGTKKIRVFPKTFRATQGFSADELFGMNLFPAGCSKTITVTEGEIDAMSAFQMLNQGSSYLNPVVSLPSASPSGKLWENVIKYLDSFKEVILSVDNDDKGQRVAEVLFDLLPSKVYVVNHGEYKDANDFLTNKQAQAFKTAWWAKKKYSPAGFTAAEDWVKAVTEEEPYTYVETPIEGLNKSARGLVRGGITVIKAPPGTGKTSLFRLLEHDLVMHKDCKVAALHLEEMKSTTARGMATYELGMNVNTKEDAEENDVPESEVIEAVKRVVADNKFVAFDVNPQDAIESCLKMVKYAVSVYEVDFIFIDHLQRLAYLTGVADATSGLTELGVRLVEFAKRKNIGIICISHVNSDGRTKYASAIEEEAIVILELSRDKDAEDAEERNTVQISQSKNRPFALTGAAGRLRYDPSTTIVEEPLEDKDSEFLPEGEPKPSTEAGF